MHGVFFGASKGIGYHTLLLFLQDPANRATLLLRKPEITEADTRIAPFATRIKLVQGDATSGEDVRGVLQGDVDFVLTSVGAAPSFGLGGIKIDQPDLCTRAAIALVEALRAKEGKLPRVIAISSMGIAENHHAMPWAMQMLYSWLLDKPHQDKVALEYILQRAARDVATPTHPSAVPRAIMISQDRLEVLPADFLPEIIIVRPALLVGGDEPPKNDGMRAGEDIATYTVSRPEVARFVARECLPPTVTWVGKKPVCGK